MNTNYQANLVFSVLSGIHLCSAASHLWCVLGVAVCSVAVATTVALGAQQAVSEDQVVELPVPEDPTVSLRIWVKAGSQNDPPGKEGLAALTARMIAEASTAKHSYDQILEKLFPLAAGYSASASVEMTVIAGRVHKDNLDEYYPLLLDAICKPAFRQDDFERLRSEALNYLENVLRYANDEELGKAVLYSEIFAGTPYAHPTAGTVQSLRNITVEDVRRFYREYYTRDNLVIGIGGGYDKQLLARLRADLGQLPSGKPAQVPPPQPRPIEGLRVTIIEKDAPATAISLGFPIDVLRGQDQWYALAVANSWLGQHRSSSSHLYQVIRERRGLNYGDYSYIEHFPNGGQLLVPPQNVCRRKQIFEIWIRPVPHEARHFALRAALRELDRLVREGLSEQQFDLTRNFLDKFILNYAPNTMARLGYALDDRFYGIQGSHLEKFRRSMKTLTLQQVNAAVREHLQCQNMHIVLVTRDGQSLKQALVKDAPSPIKYPVPVPQDILDEDQHIATFPLRIRAENVRIVPVGEVFER